MFILKIILFVFGCIIVGFAFAVVFAIRNERKDFRKQAKLHEDNIREIDKWMNDNNIYYDCEAE